MFITHDFLEALKIGDRIAIMKDGEIVQVGTPQEIVAHPVNDYVREFTKDAPRIKVLTAKTIMQPLNDERHDYPTLPAHTTLETLFGILAGTTSPFYLIEANQVIGWVDQATLMRSVAEWAQ